MKRVAIAGFGTVGQGIWQILQEQRERLAHALGEAPEVYAILVRDIGRSRDVAVPAGLLTDDPQRLLADGAIDVLLEATGDTALGYTLARQAMARGVHVITAGKALVSQSMEELSALAEEQGVHFLYEASVAGGTPVIKPLKDLTMLGRVNTLRGIINGSCNYILSAMGGEGRAYDDVIAEARALGYLEADADSDLLGWDARRKLRILATLAMGGTVPEEDIPCVGISRVTLADILALGEAGYSVKLLGRAGRADDRVAASVFPWALPKGDVLAGIGGAGNYVDIDAEYLGRVGFMGPGAGRLPTAHAMVNDLVDALLDRQPRTSPLGSARLVSLGGEQKACFYLRGWGADAFPTKRPLGPGWLTHPMPLAEVLAWLTQQPEACAIMVEAAPV